MTSYLGETYRGLRVLVTGHTGFKGAWLSLWLHHLGADVTGYALRPCTDPSLHEVARLQHRIRSVIGDVRDRTALERVFSETHPEIVFHLAAQARVDVSYTDPRGTFEVNVCGTGEVLTTALATDGFRAAVVVTSDKCYENRGWSWGYRETDALGGHDPYSASKGCQELLVSSYQRSFFALRGLGLATARAGNVIGGGDFTPGRLVPDCLRAFALGHAVRLRYPDAVRPWQHVLEPLSGYLLLGAKLIEEPMAWSEAFNFAPDADDAVAVRDVVARCSDAWGNAKDWETEAGPHRHETAVLQLDASKARQRLGWRPTLRLEQALALTVAWQKSLLAGHDMAEVTLGQIRTHGIGRG